MAKFKLSPDVVKTLVTSFLAETACLLAGATAWLATDKIIWLFTGISASLGFSLPTVIRLIRASKGQ